MSLDAAKLMRTRTRGSPSWPGPGPQTGYVDADCSDRIAEISCGRGGPYVFERHQGVLGVVPRPCRQLAQAEGAQFAAERLLADRNTEFLPDPLAQIDQPPAHDAINRRGRVAFDHRFQRRAMCLVQLRRLPGRPAGDQPVRTSSTSLRPRAPGSMQSRASSPS